METHLKERTVLVADDHALYREGVIHLLKRHSQFKVVAETGDGQELVAMAEKHTPDLILTDIRMPGMDAPHAVTRIMQRQPNIGVIVLSAYEDEFLILDMLAAGIKGYLLKSARKQEILAALDAVSRGEVYYSENLRKKVLQLVTHQMKKTAAKPPPALTLKEKEVVRLMGQQLSSREIAEHLGIGLRTVESYREKIQKKLGARNGIGVVLYGIRMGIVKL